MSVSVGDVVVGTFDVPNQNTPLAYEVTVPVQAGEHPISVAFLNDAMNPDGADRNLMVDAIELRLANAPSDDAAYERFRDGLTCSPATAPACLDAFFGTLLPVAYRRPVPATELSALTGRIQGLITQEGFTAEEAWVGGIQSVLLSPNFLFRPEFSGGALNDHELATRLSYLIWGTMPDDTLRAHADAGELTDPVVLEAEARRMFNDPRASALVDDFAGQWLWLRRIAGASPDPAVYPDTEALLPDFADEARLLVHRAFFENTVDALLTDSVIEVNPELASYYGVPAPLDGWQLVDLGGVGRVGILTNGGLLAALSNPSTTNPVRRGKWMLNQLLCEEPGDPPPGAIDSFDPQVGTGSLRDRLAQHRADPACASCHDTLDPLGFGFEAYGAGGEWRTLDDLGEPVDESGTLPGGRTFEGPMGLGAHLADDPRFALCVSEKLYTYGVGATMSPENHPYVREASGRFVREGLVFEELLVGIVLSDGFRERRP